MMISNEEPRKEKWMSFEKIIFEKKDAPYKKYESVVGIFNLKII